MRLLDPNSARRQKWILVIGIILFLCGLAVVSVGLFWAIPAIEAPYLDAKSNVSRMAVTTSSESNLKEMLIDALDNSAVAWMAYCEAKMQNLSLFLVLNGMFLMAIFYTKRNYQRLMIKLLKHVSMNHIQK